MKNKMILVILILSLLISILLSYKIENELYIEPSVYVEEGIITKETILDNSIIEIKYNWQIAIPKLGLVLPIGEGTSPVILRNRVGHIEGTGLKNGNIVLAAHNNTANYTSGNFFFDRIDELLDGDIIYYRINNQNFIYEVRELKVVEETELSILEEDKINRLTLVTCIEGKRHSRLAVICEKVI